MKRFEIGDRVDYCLFGRWNNTPGTIVGISGSMYVVTWDDGFIAQEGNYYPEDELERIYDNP